MKFKRPEKKWKHAVFLKRKVKNNKRLTEDKEKLREMCVFGEFSFHWMGFFAIADENV